MKKFIISAFIIIFFNFPTTFQSFDFEQLYLNSTPVEWTWLTSHNSHLNWYDNSVLELAANQHLSIDKQLKFGVRGFMFDISYVKCSLTQSLFNLCNCEGVCMCHGDCTSTIDQIKDGFSVKKLEYALKKLVNFLQKNKNEIITIFFEDYLTDTVKLQNVFDKVKNFNQLVFNPYSNEWNVLKNGWPKIKEMIKANKRILIFDDEQRGPHAGKSPGIIKSRDYLLQNHYEWFSDNYEWDLSNETRLRKQFNTSKIILELSRCYSLHKFNSKPNWGLNNTLILNSSENQEQLLNKDKLFLFHHYFGVAAKSVFLNQFTVELMNTKEFVTKRLATKCYPGTNLKKPNYISLDFIEENTYNDLILPFNIEAF